MFPDYSFTSRFKAKEAQITTNLYPESTLRLPIIFRNYAKVFKSFEIPVYTKGGHTKMAANSFNYAYQIGDPVVLRSVRGTYVTYFLQPMFVSPND